MYAFRMNPPVIPDTMKAVLWTGYGGYDRLEYREDIPVPTPDEGSVMVKVGAAGLNNTDINTRTGWYSREVSQGTTVAGAAAGFEESRAEDSGWTGTAHKFPRIQGADGCGRIVAVGGGVPQSRIGERVLIEPIIRLSTSSNPQVIYFGSECNGAFAEYTCVPSSSAHTISSELSDVELASFPCAYAAAEHMLERSQVTAADVVLVTGASGGVGSAADLDRLFLSWLAAAWRVLRRPLRVAKVRAAFDCPCIERFRSTRRASVAVSFRRLLPGCSAATD